MSNAELCVRVAVRQLHREFLRAGSDVMQTFTFYASDDKLANRGNSPRFTVSPGPQLLSGLTIRLSRAGNLLPPPLRCATDTEV